MPTLVVVGRRSSRFSECSGSRESIQPFGRRDRCLKHKVSLLTLCPLVQPKKAIGHEPHIEPCVDNTRIWLDAFQIVRSIFPLSLFAQHLRTVLAVKASLRRAFRRDLDGCGPFRKDVLLRGKSWRTANQSPSHAPAECCFFNR